MTNTPTSIAFKSHLGLAVSSADSCKHVISAPNPLNPLILFSTDSPHAPTITLLPHLCPYTCFLYILLYVRPIWAHIFVQRSHTRAALYSGPDLCFLLDNSPSKTCLLLSLKVNFGKCLHKMSYPPTSQSRTYCRANIARAH